MKMVVDRVASYLDIDSRLRLAKYLKTPMTWVKRVDKMKLAALLGDRYNLTRVCDMYAIKWRVRRYPKDWSKSLRTWTYEVRVWHDGHAAVTMYVKEGLLLVSMVCYWIDTDGIPIHYWTYSNCQGHILALCQEP